MTAPDILGDDLISKLVDSPSLHGLLSSWPLVQWMDVAKYTGDAGTHGPYIQQGLI
jgi:hypothetical protein